MKESCQSCCCVRGTGFACRPTDGSGELKRNRSVKRCVILRAVPSLVMHVNAVLGCVTERHWPSKLEECGRCNVDMRTAVLAGTGSHMCVHNDAGPRCEKHSGVCGIARRCVCWLRSCRDRDEVCEPRKSLGQSGSRSIKASLLSRGRGRGKRIPGPTRESTQMLPPPLPVSCPPPMYNRSV